MPDDQRAKIEEFDAAIHAYNSLRNAIAHSSWKKGKRTDSVKPLDLSVRGGRVKFKGLSEDEREYPPDELHEIANRLTLNNDFLSYLASIGLIIEATDKADASSRSTSGPPGSPSAK
jgi:hypothetical protein